ncbi:MAG: arginine--tRNA ligase [Candidatus Bipolaricaulota bacterium]|nr:arginine--tRNA ligase [Candidatus Bipolaricaulota bacterium]
MLENFVRHSLVETWNGLGFPEVEAEVQPATRPEHGDFSTNLALVGAKQVGIHPRELAARIVDALPGGNFANVEIAGPGFINFFLREGEIQSALRGILRAGDRFGEADIGGGKSLQIEFVSSNPTGPLTVGHGRQAVLGDVLATLYSALGYEVTREYYFNDEGRQIDLLAESLYERYLEQKVLKKAEIPVDGYAGPYLIDIARDLASENHEIDVIDFSKSKDFFRTEAVRRITKMIKDDLAQLGVKFNNWFSESTLHERGEIDKVLDRLRERGGVYEKDGAVWLRAEDNGGIKDSVLIRNDKRATYLMVDIAYHIDKYRRGFERVIDVQGADHQVEQSCVKAGLRILGLPEEFLDYAVHQFVSIKQGKQTARMSTRAGRFISLRALVEWIGPDVVRYFMIARKPESHLEFDLELARAQSLENPAYYIQYAHTRIASIFRRGDSQTTEPEKSDLSLLREPPELDLIKRLDRFPAVIKKAALEFAPHLLADYTLGLASAFHTYYSKYRVLGEDVALTRARLALVYAIQNVLHRSLEIMGMSAPEEM